jgi:hypothetical protein
MLSQALRLTSCAVIAKSGRNCIDLLSVKRSAAIHIQIGSEPFSTGPFSATGAKIGDGTNGCFSCDSCFDSCGSSSRPHPSFKKMVVMAIFWNRVHYEIIFWNLNNLVHSRRAADRLPPRRNDTRLDFNGEA